MRKTLLFFSIFLAACSGGSSDGPALTFADFDNPPTTSEVLGGSSTTNPPPASTTTSPTSTTTSTTLLVVDTPSPVAILTSSDYSILQGRGAPRRLLDEPVEVGFDDLQGGFLFQMPGAGIDTAADQRIFWSRASNPQAQPYLDVTDDGSLLQLWGVDTIDGAPKMILTVTDEADDPVRRIERLVVHDFTTLDRVLGEVGSAGSGPVSISYGGGRFVLEQQSGSQSFFEFRNDQGAVIDLASNPHKGCSDDPTCPTTPTLDPSGSFLAYLQAATDETVELVVYDVDLGEEIRRIGLPAAAVSASELDFEGTTVIVNPADRDGRALLVDTDRATVGEFGLPGIVRFLRTEPGFDGPVGLLSSGDAGT